MKKLVLVLVLSTVGCINKPTTEIPKPTPTPIYHVTPTPIPTPFPTNSPAPKAVPTPYQKGPGDCSGGAGVGNCKGGEGNCICHMALSRAIHGLDVDMGKIIGFSGGSPKQMFTNGGSENIGVTCNTVKYWKDGDPKWFNEYFDIQLNGDLPIFGREIFAGYVSLTLGNILVVRKKAELLGHAELEKKANLWLRAYWSIISLMATQNPIRTWEAWHFNQTTGVDSYDSSTLTPHYGGYGLNPAANRSYVNDSTSSGGLQYTMLSMALDHPSRGYDWSMDQSSGTPICGIAKALHYKFPNGKISLTSITPPASDFGLTELERSTLKNFILSNGKQGLSTILKWLEPYKLACELTIIRTENGITTWFGNETDKIGLCSRSKGGTFVATTVNQNRSISLSRATAQFYPEAATVWKENNQICEETTQRPKKCIDIVDGQVIHKLHWHDNGHISAY